ncbi:MAG: phosphatase PAP2 family protein, partial [Candidatus Pacebacteria bacterium]|nr:phosphatase PAP2 family protein [Candidatus Paceibacterota bacterium]
MLNNIFIFGAKYLFILSPILAGIFFLMQSRARQKKMLVLAAVAVPLTYVLVYILNHVYFDPRPFVVGNFTPLVPHIPDNGFPSDHT